MTFSVSDSMVKLGDDIYYEESFRNVLETHLTLLKRSNSKAELIPNDLVYQFEGNFLGLLRNRGIQQHLHWLYMRVNGFTNPNEFGAELRSSQQRAVAFYLVSPDLNFVEQIKALFLTQKK